MWKYQNRVIKVGRAWTDEDGVKHPTNWSNWDADTKAAKGLVWEDDPAPFDNRFYWSAGVPRALDDVDAVDKDGKPVLDENGVQIVTKGLKSNAIAKTKTIAGSILASTDWYVTRKAETDAEIPADVLLHREAVRTASGAIEAAIEACDTLEAFMALYDTPVDAEGNSTGNAPINDWPEEI
jgi:hypothetical protein